MDAATPVEILAFSAKQVCRLTSLSTSQLRYWDKTNFFSPEYADEYGVGSFNRVYSFRDIVGLYAIGLLRKKYKFSLQELRSISDYLYRFHETPWSSLALHVSGRELVFRDPNAPDTFISTRPKGQGLLPFTIAFEAVAQHVERKVARLRVRRRSEIGKIGKNRLVMNNAPAIAGTRIMTSAIWNFHEAGYDTDAIIEEYPRITAADVRAALEFEAQRRRAKVG
jgi:uncharacterized protein (DUF433 family)